MWILDQQSYFSYCHLLSFAWEIAPAAAWRSFHKLAPKGNILCYNIYNGMYYLSDFHLDFTICHWSCRLLCFIKATLCKVFFFYLRLTAVYLKIHVFKTYDNIFMTYWVLLVGSTYITSDKLLWKRDLYIQQWLSTPKLWSVPYCIKCQFFHNVALRLFVSCQSTFVQCYRVDSCSNISPFLGYDATNNTLKCMKCLSDDFLSSASSSVSWKLCLLLFIRFVFTFTLQWHFCESTKKSWEKCLHIWNGCSFRQKYKTLASNRQIIKDKLYIIIWVDYFNMWGSELISLNTGHLIFFIISLKGN